MRFEEIRKEPTNFKLFNGFNNGIEAHESLLRSFKIVQKVKQMLTDGATPGIVLEMIEFMESGEQSTLDAGGFKSFITLADVPDHR